MKFFTTLVLFLSLLVSCSSCDGGKIRYNPNFYGTSSLESAIVDRDGEEIVYCEDQRFDDFVCMDKVDLKRLSIILNRARIPRKHRDEINQILQPAIEEDQLETDMKIEDIIQKK